MRTRSLLWAGAGVLLLAGPAVAGEVGPLMGPFPHAGEPAPAEHSTRFVLEAVDLAQGVELPLTGGVAHLAVLSADRAVEGVRLIAPDGHQLEIAVEPGREAAAAAAEVRAGRFHEPELLAYDLPAHGLALRLARASAGVYALRGEVTGGRVAVVVNEEGSDLALQVQATPLAARHGEPVTVEALLLDGGEPVRGAQVTARVTEWQLPRHALRLTETAPGRYTGTLAAQPDGRLLALTLRVDARGVRSDGTRFLRTGLTGAMVAPGIADVELDAVRLQDESLAVPVVGAAGDYRLEAIFGVAGEEGMESLAFSREDFHFAGGRRDVSLAVPPEAAGAERLTLRLLDRNTLAVEREVELALAIDGTPRQRPALAAETLPASKRAAARRMLEIP